MLGTVLGAGDFMAKEEETNSVTRKVMVYWRSQELIFKSSQINGKSPLDGGVQDWRVC